MNPVCPILPFPSNKTQLTFHTETTPTFANMLVAVIIMAFLALTTLAEALMPPYGWNASVLFPNATNVSMSTTYTVVMTTFVTETAFINHSTPVFNVSGAPWSVSRQPLFFPGYPNDTRSRSSPITWANTTCMVRVNVVSKHEAQAEAVDETSGTEEPAVKNDSSFAKRGILKPLDGLLDIIGGGKDKHKDDEGLSR